MSISQLVDSIGKVNLAEDLDEETLTAIGQRVASDYERDRESMADWLDHVERGLDLSKQEWESKSTPWEGASNYKDPSLIQASVLFGDKASLELLRSKDLVSSEIVGAETPEKKESAGTGS